MQTGRQIPSRLELHRLRRGYRGGGELLTVAQLSAYERELLREALYSRVGELSLLAACVRVGHEWGVQDPLNVVEYLHEGPPPDQV